MKSRLGLWLFIISLRGGRGVLRQHEPAGRAPAAIPKTVFVTGPFAEESEDRREIVRNLSHISFLQRRSITERHAALRASGAVIKFFDDSAMNESAFRISRALEGAGVSSAYEAYASLRPMAYKADLWRYMVLWDEGGVYVDMNVKVLQNLSTWIDFEHDELVLIEDGLDGSYWNAIMAARPRHSALRAVIADVVEAVRARSYGGGDLDITGPEALYRVLHSIDDIEQHITVQHKLFVKSIKCGKYPKPPCAVEIVGTGDRNMNVTIAKKVPSLQSAVHGAEHYSELYQEHAVYCDEPGPPCPGWPDGET